MEECCLINISIALFLIIICVCKVQTMEQYMDEKTDTVYPNLVGSAKYRSMPWHTAGGARYYIENGDMSHSKELVSDVLAGNDGQIPLIGYASPLKGKEGFWYDMNRLEDSGWSSGTLDTQFKNMLDGEKSWRNKFTMKNVKRQGLKENEKQTLDRLSVGNTVPLESFGNNRSPVYWNEKNYPMVNTNGFNMTPLFPQNGDTHGGIYTNSLFIKKAWGEPNRI